MPNVMVIGEIVTQGAMARLYPLRDLRIICGLGAIGAATHDVSDGFYVIATRDHIGGLKVGGAIAYEPACNSYGWFKGVVCCEQLEIEAIKKESEVLIRLIEQFVGKRISISYTDEDFESTEGVCKIVHPAEQAGFEIDLIDGRHFTINPDTFTVTMVEGFALGRRRQVELV